MKPDYFQRKHRIISQRNGLWDYSFPGHYFVTTVLLRRDMKYLSKVIAGKVYLKPFGQFAEKYINDIKYWNSRVMVDEYVIMPDHIHLLINIAPFDLHNGFSMYNDHERERNQSKEFNELIFKMDLLANKRNATEAEIEKYELLKNQYRKLRRRMIIPKIIGRLKAQSSKEFNLLRKKQGYKNWLRDYHCSIVTPTSYFRVKTYIRNNPEKYNNKPPNLVRRLWCGDYRGYRL